MNKLAPGTLLVGRSPRSVKVYGKTTYVPAVAKAKVVGFDDSISAYRVSTWLEVEGGAEQHNKKLSIVGVNWFVSWEVVE